MVMPKIRIAVLLLGHHSGRRVSDGRSVILAQWSAGSRPAATSAMCFAWSRS